MKVGLVFYQLIYNMNPNIDMTYTRSFIDVSFGMRCMIFTQRRTHKAFMRKECWLPSPSELILLVRSESTLLNVFFQAPFVGHIKKWNAHESGLLFL